MNFYLWLGKFRTKQLQKNGKFKTLHASNDDLGELAKIYFNDLKECKYLLGGGAAALFFVIEAYDIDLSNTDLGANAVLLPFLVSFLFAAVGYWNSYKMDGLFFPLKILAKLDVRNDEQEQDLSKLTDIVHGRNYIISGAVDVSAFAFLIGIIIVVLTVLRPSFSVFF